MKSQHFNNVLTNPSGRWKISAISVFFLLTITFASAWTVSAQNSTNSTQTPNPTVTINGQKYVLVPERTFGQIELLTKEVPALREENAALKADKANNEKIIETQNTIAVLKQKEIDATNAALAASQRETEAIRSANAANEKAVTILQARVTDLEGQVKRANKRTLWAVIGGAAAILLLK